MIQETFSLAIVTVTFNSLCSLRKTCLSIQSQIPVYGFRFEHVIIDAASDDGTLDYLQSGACSLFVSEPDGGIYDAMNKGCTLSSMRNHTHVLFLNAGDTLSSNNVLLELSKKVNCLSFDSDGQSLGRLLLIGDSFFTGFTEYLRLQPAFNPRHIYFGMPFCHQSVIMPIELLLEYPFDVSYKSASDYAWFCASYMRGDLWFYLKFPISVFVEDGLTASLSGSTVSINESIAIKKKILGLSRLQTLFVSYTQKSLFFVRRKFPFAVYFLRRIYSILA
jgi:putative colanic acid biosynthesis glycosyltransferase